MNLLVADGDRLIRWALKERLGRAGYAVEEAADGAGALEAIGRAPVEAVLLDLGPRDPDGLAVLREIRRRDPDLPVIMIASLASVETAVESMRIGAYDYIEKPFHTDDLVQTVRRAVDVGRMRRRARARLREERERWGLHSLIARSAALKSVLATVRRIAATDARTILLSGESGTGKDAIARAIHVESKRAARPFLAIACSTLQEALFESELFGHVEGSFTGAATAKEGLLEGAEGGTVFLDEVCEVSLSIQAKLLRVLEERSYRRVGDGRDLRIDVRMIAATNRNPERAVAEGRLREDLYYRLNAITLELPPLRERPEDIVPLAEHFLRRYARELRKDVADIEPAGRAKLEVHDWPGNVRELRNAIERATLIAAGPVIPAADLFLDAPPRRRRRLLELPPEGLRMDDLERDLLAQALAQAGGNRARAGELLGMTREQVQYRIEKYGPVGAGPALP